MNNITDTIRSRHEAVTARLEELRAQVVKAEIEKADLQTTLRVLGEFGGDATPKSTLPERAKTARPANEKKRLMFDLLGVGKAGGKQPAEVHKTLVMLGEDDISIQVVRTTLWRAASKGELDSQDGRYWKHEAEGALFSEPSAHSSSAGVTTGEAKSVDRWSDQLDSPHVPFEPERGGGT